MRVQPAMVSTPAESFGMEKRGRATPLTGFGCNGEISLGDVVLTAPAVAWPVREGESDVDLGEFSSTFVFVLDSLHFRL